MKRLWLQFAVRLLCGMLFAILVIAVPVGYMLFAADPFNPAATLASWRSDNLLLRCVVVAAYALVLSLLAAFAASRGAENPFEQLAASIRRIGTRDFQVRLGPFRFKEPHEFAEIAEAFNTMAAELQRAEELRGSLMADVSHELRTPLTVLESNLRAALDRVYPLGDAEIANLYGQTRHLIRLVNDLHELALAEAHRLPLNIAPTNLCELIDETVQIFAPLADERGVALCAALPELPILELDDMRVRQVLHNLLTNALRHTPCGGEIRVVGATNGERVTVAVCDTGDGLEPDQVRAVFDRFYRTDRSRSRDTGGTGLGLAIASALIDAHGGRISAVSDGLGAGSTFTISLPCRARAGHPL